MSHIGWIKPCGLAFVVLLSACSAPKLDSGLYHSPARAYSLSLDSNAFRGAVALTEQCDSSGGSLNIWDSTNRFFRVDYLKIGQHPLADAPSFASERTIAEQVLSNYLRKVIPSAPNIENSETVLREYVDTGRGDAMFSVVNIKIKPNLLPDGVTNPNYYYGFLIFPRGDFVYILQHRVDNYQPDWLKQTLSNLRQDMLVPGVLRPASLQAKKAPKDKEIPMDVRCS